MTTTIEFILESSFQMDEYGNKLVIFWTEVNTDFAGIGVHYYVGTYQRLLSVTLINESRLSVIRIPEQIIILICVTDGLLCTSKNIAEGTVNNLRPLPSKPTHEESINCGTYGNYG